MSKAPANIDAIEERLNKLLLIMPNELADSVRCVVDDNRALMAEVKSLRSMLDYRVGRDNTGEQR